MTWDPRKMAYGEMERAQKEANLCGRCLHRQVCPVPADLARRVGWFLSIATCEHYAVEGVAEETFAARQEVDSGYDPDRAARSLADMCEQQGEAGDDPAWPLRFAVGVALVADAHARSSADEAERARVAGTLDAERCAMAQHAARFAARELSAARRTLEKFERGEA